MIKTPINLLKGLVISKKIASFIRSFFNDIVEFFNRFLAKRVDPLAFRYLIPFINSARELFTLALVIDVNFD